MPRGHKSKSRSRSKRQNARAQKEGAPEAQSTAEKEAASPAVGQLDSPNFPNVFPPHVSQGDISPVSPDTSLSCTGSDVAAQGSDVRAECTCIGACGGIPSASEVFTSIMSAGKDPLTRKAGTLMEYILDKFKRKEHFTQADMLRVINRKYKADFPEILRRLSVRLELVFGLELKEIDPSISSYTLVGKLGLSTEGSLSGDSGLPKTGLLMILLAVIFMKGNRATEKEIWEYLNMVGIYAGRKHLIFEEPQKFLTIDLVKENYLEYRQLPNSDPPHYEFLWGSRAYAETTKMKVLEFLAKINDTVPSAFPDLYEEALYDEINRAARTLAIGTGTVGNVRVHPRGMSFI